MEALPAVVLDGGSASMKAGFAGETYPQLSFPSIVGRPRFEIGMRGSYVGAQVRRRSSLLVTKRPIQGTDIEWEDLEKLWRHTYDELQATPEDRPVLLTQPALNSRENMEKMVQTMFETFGTPSVYIANQSILALYAIGRVAGLVVDCGDSATYTMPVVDGVPVREAIQSLNFAGSCLTDYFRTCLSARGHFFRQYERGFVSEVKEKMCYVALDFEASLKSCEEKKFSCPDGQEITLREECFQCPELLFNPMLIRHHGDPVPVCAFKSIQKCEDQQGLYKEIVLSGGSTMYEGFAERFTKEMEALAPESQIQVISSSSPSRLLLPWFGGSVLASLSSFKSLLLTKAEYQELGSSAAETKFNLR